jgi:hypothetical protein
MQVFISYASSDQERARDLASALTRAGYTPWVDDIKLMPGDNWPRKIEEPLEGSHAMIVLLSPDWAESRWSRRELEWALGSPNYEGRVIPVRLRPMQGRETPWILDLFPKVDATRGWARAKDQVIEALKRTAGVAD